MACALAVRLSAGTQNTQPSGAGGHDGSGRQSGGGTKSAGAGGQPGGGLNRQLLVIAAPDTALPPETMITVRRAPARAQGRMAVAHMALV
ncbi:hypothetical protein KGQ20_27020, partial [Catenulispora sp. NF23]